MSTNRRDFLKIAGASALTLIMCPILPVCARENLQVPEMESAPAKPLTAKRWAMAIDTSKCSPGCTDCVAACHAVHNVPNIGNSKDDVKWIWTEPFASVFPAENHSYSGQAQQKMRVPVLCNQCANPPCVRVCPTQATFKRADGIVMMDYHRCIGCRLCMAACPYGARSMNYRDPRPFIAKINPDFPTRTKGVVEKCNFCQERLAKGLLPACVLACKSKALVFGDVEDPHSEIRKLIENRFTLRRRASLGTVPQIYYIL
ncbi:MAG TPA: 4Fe-4S dicluster domain-containing protein [Smithellaceae bacterium]|nr:4Fe-4S dicluster domain-containing protein [Smithellaceae bacterium]